MAKNRHFYGFFARFRAIFGVLQRTLTPSFVGSNPATPATDTIYCIRLSKSNTIYGFCFIWLVFLFPKLGKEMGKLFGLNFVFCFVFQPVLPAYAGFFVLLLLFQKIGLGKLLSINYLFGFFHLKFLRVVRVYRGGDRAAQTVSRPNTHDFACNAGLFATADKCVPQFVRVVVGQQPLHARRYSVEVGVLRFLKVDIREYLFHLRCERNLPKHDILPQPFLARFAL